MSIMRESSAIKFFIILILSASIGESANAEFIPKMSMTTETPASIIVPDKIETLIGTLEFFDGFPNAETVKKAYDFLDFQRGVDIFLDEMRAASMVALREGHRQLGITESHQMALFENLLDSKALWLTANSETVYASTFIDLKKNGPTVIESPPNILGILDDMWMRYVGDIGNAGPDKGKGGRFLILPPGFKGNPPEGYHAFRSKTYKLRLPPNVPAKDFWSIVLYDSQTRAMLQTDQQFHSLNSERGGVEQNADGSFDIYFGPKPPEGKASNWIQTVPGKAFWLLLRLYGPLEPWFEKTWRPGKIELVN